MNAPTALNAAFASGDTAAVIAETLLAANARSVLDVGCGRGALARALTGRGFSVTGVDPSTEAIEAARSAVTDARFAQGIAEELPIEASSVDAVVFLNSLHHVAVPRMETALHEAVRAVRPGGTIVIVEPLPEGPFNALLRVVNDESEVRNAASRAVANAARAELFELRGNVVYERRERFDDLAALIDRICSVDPRRRRLAEKHRSELEALFREHSVVEDNAHVLTQPLRIYLLRAPSR